MFRNAPKPLNLLKKADAALPVASASARRARGGLGAVSSVQRAVPFATVYSSSSPLPQLSSPSSNSSKDSKATSTPRRNSVVSVGQVLAWKDRRKPRPITMLTAYDAPTARLAAEANLDILLVGDSLGMVVLGHAGTNRVTLDQISSASAAVTRGLNSASHELRENFRRPLVIGDLPFGAYLTVEDAVHSSAVLIKEGGVDAVKLEGGLRVVPQVKAVVDCGIPVMGHVGLTPQTSGRTFVTAGKTKATARGLIEDALALQEAGCFCIVLECVPTEVAELVTAALQVPTIGIGAGPKTTGQVLVLHDVIGMYQQPPSFSKQFADVRNVMLRSLNSYRNAVTSGQFPGESHVTHMQPEQLAELEKEFPEVSRGIKRSSSEPAKVIRDHKDLGQALPFQNVDVLGGGAIGMAFASALADSGANVQLRTRRSVAATQISEQGGVLVRDAASGIEKLSAVVARTERDPNFRPDIVVLAHKQSSDEDCRAIGKAAVEILKENPNTMVLTLQNGAFSDSHFDVENGNLLRQRLIQGITYSGAAKDPKRYGSVTLNGRALTHVFPTPGSTVTSTEVMRLMATLNHAGLPCQLEEKFGSVFWGKLATNAVVNSITAALDVENGALAKKDGPLYEVVAAASRELSAVARESLKETGEENSLAADPEALLKHILAAAQATSTNTSSMRADVRAGRAPELEPVCGFVLNRASQYALQTPVMSALTALIRAKDDLNARTVRWEPERPEVLLDVAQMRAFVRKIRSRVPDAKVAFIPTMGALHEGHLDLVRRAKEECDVVCVSILVNPTQFAPGEDFNAYPRTFESDMAKLSLVGVDAVFHPDAREFYGENFISYIHPRGMSGELKSSRQDVSEGFMPEGDARPGFFIGVATVVAKLFNAVQPDRAYFGQKDAQQCVVVRRLAQDLNFPLDVVICETRRESDGLAMSSRNAYLDAGQRRIAPTIFQALSRGVEAARLQPGRATKSEVEQLIRRALGSNFEEIQYISVANALNGKELADTDTLPCDGTTCISIAAIVAPTTAPAAGSPAPRKVRLIDNVLV